MIQLLPRLREQFRHIIFDQATHTYTINGDPLRPLSSVTKTIGEVKPVFDKDAISKRVAARDGITQEEVLQQWQDGSLHALAKGSATHAYIEDLLQGRVDRVVEEGNGSGLPETKAFKAAWWNLKRSHDARIVAQELVVGDEELGVAGMVDAIVSLEQQWHWQGRLLHIFDWKTGKKFDASNRYEKLLYPFRDLDSCHLNMYSLQTSLYRLVLERAMPDLVFGDSYLVHLRTDGTHFVYRARDYRERMKSWLVSRRLCKSTQ